MWFQGELNISADDDSILLLKKILIGTRKSSASSSLGMERDELLSKIYTEVDEPG